MSTRFLGSGNADKRRIGMGRLRFMGFRLIGAVGLVIVLATAASAGLIDRLVDSELDVRERAQAAADQANRRASQAKNPFAISGPAAGANQKVAGIQTPGVASVSVTTPVIKIEEICNLDQCHSATTVSMVIATPRVDSIDLETKEVAVPETCAQLVCVGAFRIPANKLARTPSIDSMKFAPSATVPAVCSAASDACLGDTTVESNSVLTPEIASLRATDDIYFEVSVNGLSGLMASHVGEMWSLGPMRLEIPVPMIGAVPVTVCPKGCLLPVLPEAELDGNVTVTLSTGAAAFKTAVPLSIEL